MEDLLKTRISIDLILKSCSSTFANELGKALICKYYENNIPCIEKEKGSLNALNVRYFIN